MDGSCEKSQKAFDSDGSRHRTGCNTLHLKWKIGKSFYNYKRRRELTKLVPNASSKICMKKRSYPKRSESELLFTYSELIYIT